MVQFTLRDVLWLVVVVALLIGWAVDHRLQVERAELFRQLLGRSMQQPAAGVFGRE